MSSTDAWSRTPDAGRARRIALRYVAALAPLAVPAVLTLAFAGHQRLNPLLSLSYCAAVAAAAWIGGIGAGLVSIAGTILVLTGISSGGRHLLPASFDPAGLGALLLIVVMSGGFAATRKRMEKLLRESNLDLERRVRERTAELDQARSSLHITLTSIGDAVLATDREGRVTFLNPIASSLTGWVEADAVGRPVTDLFVIVNEETRLPVVDPVGKVLQTGLICGLANHTVLIARDGREFPIDDSAAPIRDSRGELVGVVLTFRDITERRATENERARQAAALREREEQFRTLANAMPQMVWMAKPDGFIFWYNQRWYEYTGATQEQMEGWGWESVHDPDVLPQVLKRWQASLAAGEPFEMTFPLRGRDGTFRPFLTRSVPLRDADNRVVLWFGTNTDISEQRRIEQALRESEADLKRVNTELARSNQDLESFAFVASHDLQEPLRIVTSYSQLLERSLTGQIGREPSYYLETIVEAAKRMRELLTDLLAYAEAGAPGEREPETVDLNTVLDRAKASLQSAIEESGAQIECEGLPMIRANAAHFEPLFQNLISNAIKYRGEGVPRIRIFAEDGDGELRFGVADNGLGIAPEYHQRIFETFKRLHGREIPGTGVGLAICQRLVQRYGGRIWVESEEGRGATFFFAIPDVALRAAGVE